MRKIFAYSTILTFFSILTLTLASNSQAQPLQTPFEISGFETHSSYSEMTEYLYRVNAQTSDMILGTFGTTLEGRDLFYGVFSRSGAGSPAEAHATGKPIVVLSANVHGHNHILREALLIMARDLGTPGTRLNQLLDDIIVVMVPSKNPDGLELNDRFNPLGADLNRDYTMLEQPSMAAFIGNIINKWNPHIMVDGHDGGAVQFGGAYPYNLLYQSSALAGADQSIVRLADEGVFPYLNSRMEDAGYRSFYWAHGDEEAYYGGGHAPRMGRNYGGLANKMSILFELAAWHDAETAVSSGKVGYTAILEYARDNSEELIRTLEDARRETVRLGREAEGTVPVRERMVADDFRVSYEIQDPERHGETISVENAEIIKKPEGTEFRDRPWAYVLPPHAFDAVNMLRRHNIRVERITESKTVEATAYRMGGLNYQDTDNNHRSALLIDVEAEVQDRFEIPKGSYLVPTGQLLGRVVTHLMEPENSDNIFYWNRMTSLIPIAQFEAYREDPQTNEAPLLPMWKLMTETPLSTVAF
ncbi:MAG: hypothetical protein EA390_10560 [Balneolaceae bacterium]|nr:MAG: hypothetical protein EA390_10560 [Balneolaceae bacterium]